MPLVERVVSQDDSLQRLVGQLAGADRSSMMGRCILAMRYLRKEMLGDVEGLLQQRFPTSQTDPDTGQRIVAYAIPLVARYVAEAASIYSRPVRRYLVDERGETNEILIRTGKVAGLQLAVQSLLALAHPNLPIDTKTPEYPALENDAAWNDGQKLENQ